MDELRDAVVVLQKSSLEEKGVELENVGGGRRTAEESIQLARNHLIIGRSLQGRRRAEERFRGNLIQSRFGFWNPEFKLVHNNRIYKAGFWKPLAAPACFCRLLVNDTSNMVLNFDISKSSVTNK